MPRRGRELEKLVSIIEQSLAQTGAVIRSPDYIPDTDSGEQREVDISIRFRAGSVDVFIAVECRDRATAADVIWIEQLISKRRSIKADKMIAVSAKGFSRLALEKAHREGIETRILKKIKPKDVKSWISGMSLSMSYLRYKALGGKIEVYRKPNEDPAQAQIEWNDTNGNPRAIFRVAKLSSRMNTAELFEYLRSIEGLPPTWSDSHGPISFWAEQRFESGAVSVETSKGLYDVSYVKIGFEVEASTTPLAARDGYEYVSPAESIARHMKFSGQLQIEGKPLDIVVSTTITTRQK